MLELIADTASSMHNLGKKLASLLKARDVLYLDGDLGVGKTTLVQGIAQGLNYEGLVTSPTFTIMNIYPTNPEIYHYDFYRLEIEDLDDLGLTDYVEQDGITIIEWPKLDSDLLPEDALIVTISLLDDDYDRARKVVFTAVGERYQPLLEELKD